MTTYPKIENIFIRDETTHKLINGVFRQPEVELLQYTTWFCTEKIDGMNIRVIWTETGEVKFAGRTDAANLPPGLLKVLKETFTPDKFNAALLPPMILFGEGFGGNIQKGHGYGDFQFALFDIYSGSWWYNYFEMRDVAYALKIKCAPLIFTGNLHHAVEMAKVPFLSEFGNFQVAEGLVAKHSLGLRDRYGNRLVVKIKTRDF